MSSSRERFEAWLYVHRNETWSTVVLAREAWQARDAEVQRLVDALRFIRPYIYGLDNLKKIDALLREYDITNPRD